MQHFQPPIINHIPETILSPEDIVRTVENAAVTKAALPLRATLALALLAGAYLSLGGVFYSAAVAGLDYGMGPTRILGGLAFALGFVFVVIAGGELFTSNMLMMVGVADGRIRPWRLAGNWALVLAGNLGGAALVVACVAASGLFDGAQGEALRTAAAAKLALPADAVLARGILCNMFVCLGFWLSVSARTTSGKILALIWPVAAPVAIGLEHCVANLYTLGAGLAAGADGSWAAAALNIAAAALGNLIGAALIAFGYRTAYPRTAAPA